MQRVDPGRITVNTLSSTPTTQAPLEPEEGGGVHSPDSHLVPKAQDPGLHFPSGNALLDWERRRDEAARVTMGDPKFDKRTGHAARIESLNKNLVRS